MFSAAVLYQMGEKRWVTPESVLDAPCETCPRIGRHLLQAYRYLSQWSHRRPDPESKSLQAVTELGLKKNPGWRGSVAEANGLAQRQTSFCIVRTPRASRTRSSAEQKGL